MKLPDGYKPTFLSGKDAEELFDAANDGAAIAPSQIMDAAYTIKLCEAAIDGLTNKTRYVFSSPARYTKYYR
jgi:hypothetical protein